LDTQGEGICTGPCTAFLDLNGDGLCDRLPAAAQVAVTSSDSPASERVCPFGLVNDPYPGECHLYVDADGDSICDLSQNYPLSAVAPQPAAGQNAEPPLQAGEPTIYTACPLGLVNDPYPGECRRYVDANGNGICDLSEPELVASGAVAAPSGNVTTPTGGTHQRNQRGRNR